MKLSHEVVWSCTVEEEKASQQNSLQELESSLKQCQDFVSELMERSEAWPFRRPVSRKEVSSVTFL